jgi:hypothetical protein
MNVLGFEISTDASSANAQLESLSSRFEKLQAQTEQLYEGPAREMKIRSEVSSMIKELSIGADPLNAFISTMDRLSETFRFALPVAIGVAAITAIVEEEVKAKEAAVSWLDSIRDGAMKARDGTVEGLKEGLKMMEDAEKKYDEMGWLERIMLGKNRAAAKALLEEEIESAKDKLEAHDVADEQNKTAAMSGDPEVAHAAEVAETKKKYEEDIQKLRNAGEREAAEFKVLEETAALEKLQREWLAKQTEKEDREKKHAEDLAQLTEDEAMAGRSRLDQLGQKLSDLQGKLKAEDPDSDQGIADRREILSTQKEYDAEKARIAKEASDAEQKTIDSRAQLNSALAKMGYDELTLEEKIAALKQEAARVQYQMSHQDYGDADAQLKDEIRLGQIDKAMKELTPKANEPFKFDAENALRGNMASGGVANLAASRAETQRDQMVSLLQKLVGKPDLSVMEGF